MGIVRTVSLDLAAVTNMDEADDTGGFAPWWRIVSSHLAATLPPSAFLPFPQVLKYFTTSPVTHLRPRLSRDAGQTAVLRVNRSGGIL